MLKQVATSALLVLLAGCVSGPTAIAYKPGSTFGQRLAAADQCRIESIQKIPQAMMTIVTPPEYHPGIEVCRTDPSTGRERCRESGFVYPGSTRTRDVNASLRERYIAGCMRRSGFEVIAKPICTSSSDKAYLAGRDSQPPADMIACVAAEERLIPSEWR